MKRSELEELAEELGATLTNDGKVWTAEFPEKQSKVDPSRTVRFQGSRKSVGLSLLDIKEWRRIRNAHQESGG